MSKCFIVDDDGIELFSVDFMPVIGMTFRYCVEDCSANNKFFEDCSSDYMSHIKSMNGKSFEVNGLHCVVRNYGGKEVLAKFAHVKEVNDG